MATDNKFTVVKVRPSGNPIGPSSKAKNIPPPPPSYSKSKITSTITKTEVKEKASSSSSKTLSKKKTTTVVKKREKKVYSLAGQKYDPPEEREPLRIFYESLSKQIPSSEMAEFWMMEHGLLSPERAKKAYDRKQRKQKQIRSGMPIKSPPPPPPPSRRESSKKPQQQMSNNGDVKAKKRIVQDPKSQEEERVKIYIFDIHKIWCLQDFLFEIYTNELRIFMYIWDFSGNWAHGSPYVLQFP